MPPSAKGKPRRQQEPALAQEEFIYFRLLKSHPAAVNTIQSIIVSWLAIMTTASLSNRGLPSVQDFVIQALVQGMYITPIIGAFVGFLQRQKKLSPVYKIALDQFVFSPFFTYGIVLAFRLLNTLYADLGADVSTEYAKTLREVFQNTVKLQAAAWMFWIPQRTFSSLFVPDLLALPFNTVCSYFWVCVFDFLKK